MKWSRVLILVLVFLALTIGTAAAAPRPYVIVVSVSANHVCDGDGWALLGGSRITAIFENGSRRRFITDGNELKIPAVGEVILEIEYPARVLPCPNSPTRQIVSPPPAKSGGPIVPPPPQPLMERVNPPPSVVGALSLPTVTVEFRGRQLTREN